MTGSLPREMINLNLTHLLTRDTMICIPVDDEFQAWLRTVMVKELSSPCTE